MQVRVHPEKLNIMDLHRMEVTKIRVGVVVMVHMRQGLARQVEEVQGIAAAIAEDRSIPNLRLYKK
jgi:hypothetical protein